MDAARITHSISIDHGSAKLVEPADYGMGNGGRGNVMSVLLGAIGAINFIQLYLARKKVIHTWVTFPRS